MHQMNNMGVRKVIGVKDYIWAIIACIFIVIIFSTIFRGCNLGVFIAPEESVLDFSIDSYKGKWVSGGFEAVADERGIVFSSKNAGETAFNGDGVIISLKEPVKEKVFDKSNSSIDFFFSSDQTPYPLLNNNDPRLTIRIDLQKWSSKPRGLIEGDIEAILYDFKGKPYQMKGHFKAYQAMGTINSVH
jgi:hypothetical protein